MMHKPLSEGVPVEKINEYLTVGEAASLLGVSKDTLRRWDRAGKLTARRHPVTDYRLYLRAELQALLASLKARAASMRQTTERRKGGST